MGEIGGYSRSRIDLEAVLGELAGIAGCTADDQNGLVPPARNMDWDVDGIISA